jgi:hypothetical protein
MHKSEPTPVQLEALSGIARGHYTVNFPGYMGTPEALPTFDCPPDAHDVATETMEALERLGLIEPRGKGANPLTEKGHAALRQHSR